MPDLFTLFTCAGLAIVTWLYSRVLRTLRPRYEPRWVWVTVVVGNTLVGLAVALRLFLLPVSPYDSMTLLVWGWWQWVWHFVAGGLPIIVWQVLDDREALAAALKAATERKGPQA